MPNVSDAPPLPKTPWVKVSRNTLLGVINELRDLRRRNEILGAKVETMELCAAMLFGSPATKGYAHSPDVAHELQQALDEADTQE